MTPIFDVDGFVRQLRALLEKLPPEPGEETLSATRVARLRREITRATEALEAFSRQIDAIEQPPLVFDPSDPSIIGQLIARTLLEQPRHLLGEVTRFYGSGVYSLYYRGDFPAYTPIRRLDHPIYIGKADPAAPEARTVEEQKDRLSRRLREHAKSIRAAENLNIAYFDCRYLVVKSAWQKTAEEYLIRWFKPIWNSEINICYGFGKHGDSPGTRRNTRSPWDTLHPGRSWATRPGNVPNPKTRKQLLSEIAEHFRRNPPVRDLATLRVQPSSDNE
jgi:hypothetical protein